MKKPLLIILLLATSRAFSQFDFDLFKSYTEASTQQRNKKLISVTEYHQDKGQWTKTSLQQFNLQGLPTILIQYDLEGNETVKKELIYDSVQCISQIETYKNDKHEETTEFETNSLGHIVSFTDFVYSSYVGEKILVWETILEYNHNGTLKRTTKLEGTKKDTVKTDFYNETGVLTKSLWNYNGLRTKKIEYIWNNDRSEMKEVHYENDTTTYNTITHSYKYGKEVKKTDMVTSPKSFYWKYDDNGRIIETNEQYFYVQYFLYGKNGYLTNKTIKILFSDSDEKDLPEKIEFKYEYKFRIN